MGWGKSMNKLDRSVQIQGSTKYRKVSSSLQNSRTDIGANGGSDIQSKVNQGKGATNSQNKQIPQTKTNEGGVVAQLPKIAKFSPVRAMK